MLRHYVKLNQAKRTQIDVEEQAYNHLHVTKSHYCGINIGLSMARMLVAENAETGELIDVAQSVDRLIDAIATRRSEINRDQLKSAIKDHLALLRADWRRIVGGSHRDDALRIWMGDLN